MRHVDLPEEAIQRKYQQVERWGVVGATDPVHADRLWEIAQLLEDSLSTNWDGPAIRLSRGVHRVATRLRDGSRLVATARPGEDIWCVHVDGRLAGWVDAHNTCVYAAD